MGLDFLTLGIGFLSFVIFLLLHVALFRWVNAAHLLKALKITFLAALLLPGLFWGILVVNKAINLTLLLLGVLIFISIIVTGLLCFFYILCIFGPFETSVRMRLLREIAAASYQGITHKELLQRYNPLVITEIRLERLIGSGDLIEKNGQYRIGLRGNVFFIFDAVAGMLKRWTHPGVRNEG